MIQLHYDNKEGFIVSFDQATPVDETIRNMTRARNTLDMAIQRLKRQQSHPDERQMDLLTMIKEVSDEVDNGSV